MAAMRKKLVERRKKQMDGILEEAQLWAVLMLLPTRFVSKDSEVNRAAEGVNRTLLGDHIEKEKINRTFRKVAQKILVRGLHKDYYQESPRPVTSDLETLELSEDWRAPESVLQSIRDECCYVIERASTYTWRELKALGEGVVIFEQPLRLWLRERQLVFAGIDVGQPRHCPWTRDEEVRVRSKLCSPEPSDIWLDHSVDFVSKDFIAICADRCKSPYGWQAWMSDSNVLTLHPSFFTGTGCDSVCALRIDPIWTDPRELANVRVLTLIHETMHSKSVLWTEDHVIRINQKRLDEMEDVDWNYLFEKKGTASATSDSHQRQHPTKTDEDGHHVTEEEIHDDRYDEQDDEIYRDFVAYGLMQCMELIRRDGEDDTRKAEDNADSWAICALFRVLTLAYPEHEFLNPWIHIMQRRKLLHHCSLFDCLRHPEAGLISQLPGYDAKQDSWAEKEKPKNVKELLDVVLRIIRGEEREKKRKTEQRRRKRTLKAEWARLSAICL